MSFEISHDLLNATDHTESAQLECCGCRVCSADLLLTLKLPKHTQREKGRMGTMGPVDKKLHEKEMRLELRLMKERQRVEKSKATQQAVTEEEANTDENSDDSSDGTEDGDFLHRTHSHNHQH